MTLRTSFSCNIVHMLMLLGVSDELFVSEIVQNVPVQSRVDIRVIIGSSDGQRVTCYVCF